jgi:uncharacterized protein (TIGR02596 family)
MHRDISLHSFTLVEMLVVLAIIGILTVISVPAITSVVRSSGLTTGGASVMSEIDLARQTAMARNCQVEFRFYKLPDSGAPAGSSPTVYRAFQIFSLDDDGSQTNAVTKVVFLPANIIITNSDTLSSLLPSTPSDPPYAVSGSAAGNPLGPYSPPSYSYMDFHFRANGSTDLNPDSASTWFVTLVNEHDSSSGANGLPANFFTIQVDPLTGRARSFRP